MGKLNRRYTSIVPKFAHNGIQSIASKLLKTSDDKRGKRFKINRLLKEIKVPANELLQVVSGLYIVITKRKVFFFLICMKHLFLNPIKKTLEL